MTSGNKKVKISLASEFRPQDFSYHHQFPNCGGEWGLLVQQNIPFPVSTLGTTLLPMAAFVACPKCKAAYLLPGFQDLIEHIIATNIVVSERLLKPNEIKFLRLMFDLTQQQVCDEIDAESVPYYSKCETGKVGFALSPDKQVRLKLLYATRLGISSADAYHRISLTSGKREQPEPGLVCDLQPHLDKLKKLTEEFKSQHHLPDLPLVKQG